MVNFDFLKFVRGRSERDSASKGPLRPSPIRPPMFTRPKKEEGKTKKEPGAFDKMGWTTEKKLQETFLKAHSEVRKIPTWAARKHKSEIFEKYLPGKEKKHYSRKELQKRLRGLEKEKLSIPAHKRKDIRKTIEAFKKVTES